MTATVSQPTQTAMDVPAKDENGTAPALASQDVGLIFVREYYTFLNRKPQRLYAFYGENSVLVRGDEGESVSTYHGQEEIRKKFQDLQFNDCKVLVTQVDSQHSADNGIIIQVLGEMSNMDNPSQKFAQTFFLAPQHNGYYVLNDIFRFLKDEVNIDYYACEEEELEEQQALEAPKTVQEDKVPEPADMQPASVQPDSVVSPVSSEKSKTASPKVKDQAIGSPAKEDKRKDEKQKETKAGASEKIVEKKGEAGARAAETKPVETKKEKTALANAVDVPTEKKTEEPAVDSKEKEMPATPTKTAPEKRPGSPKQVQSSKQAEKPAAAAAKSTAPKTWANLAANDSDKWGTHVADAKGPVASVPSSQQPKQSQQTQHLQQGTSQAQPQHQNQQQQQQQQHGGHGHGHGHKEQYQIFVKNVVSHIQEDSLRDAFSQFGTVKNVNVMHNRNAAFVDFATTEAVQKALSQHKVNIGNHVVLAEERRHGGNRHQYNKQQQQSGQQRSFDRRYQQDGGHRRGNAGGAGRGNKQQQQRGNSGQK